MRGTEKLLGFDAREMGLKPEEAWSQERKAIYLLRTDVDKPLSTDTLVWPSVLPLDEDLSPDSSASFLRLWNSLPKLQEHLNVIRNSVRQPYWIIGITVVMRGLSQAEKELWYPRLSKTVPSARNKDWEFLGYDVSDLALLSALSNCGYKPDEIQSLRARWAKHLNKFHLFTDKSQAIEFKGLSDQRVVEHAPFFVFGLYRIEGY